jgi:pimeloyl-ACP methyl ester carboxylesterase
VHGAWHGAWCWEENFLPYFAQRGFTVHALSFRNHGRSEHVGSLRWKRGADYVTDVEQIVRKIGTPPVLVGHSLGGYVVQKYMERHRVPAAVLLASVPPQGALMASLRTLRKHPWAFLKTNLQMRLWPIIGTPQLTRDAFFSDSMPQEKVERYFKQMGDEAYLAYVDIVFLNLPRRKRIPRTPMLVMNGTADGIFTPGEARSTARAYGAELEIYPGMAHDLMLEEGWERVADRVITWLRGLARA